MRIANIILAMLVITTQISVSSRAEAKSSETEIPLVYEEYNSSPIMVECLPLLDVPQSHASEHSDTSHMLRSPHNPWYYVNQKSELEPAQLRSAIEQYGLIDINQAILDASSLPTPLHPLVDILFKRLARYYQSNPYIGNMDAGTIGAAGWFGGISINTLFMLSEIAEIQSSLTEEKKIKVLGIGSGGGFFESLFNAIGIETMAMDVQDERVSRDFRLTVLSMAMKMDPALDQNRTISVRDYADIERRKIQNSFFMPVKIYQQKVADHYGAIIADVFRDVDYTNTVLVFSWPRKFANDYIRYFLRNGGKSILFIRNESVADIFDDVYLGNSHVSFCLNSSAFRKTSLELNTAAGSVIDLYCRGEITPMEEALQRAISRVNPAET